MSQTPQIEPLPAGLVHEPLNWLFAEHYRHRQLCRLIERVGTATILALHERRHIALENAVILPIARLRLTPQDLHALSTRMAARRGVFLDRSDVALPLDDPDRSGAMP